MELHLRITGVLLILLALTHVVFPRYFKWRAQLALISHINRQMVYIHTFFIAFTVLLMGLLCLTSAAEMITTKIGKNISLGLGVFWLVRLSIQFVGYSSLHWKGKPFETKIHVLLLVLWTYLSAVFLLVYFS